MFQAQGYKYGKVAQTDNLRCFNIDALKLLMTMHFVMSAMIPHKLTPTLNHPLLLNSISYT